LTAVGAMVNVIAGLVTIAVLVATAVGAFTVGEGYGADRALDKSFPTNVLRTLDDIRRECRQDETIDCNRTTDKESMLKALFESYVANADASSEKLRQLGFSYSVDGRWTAGAWRVNLDRQSEAAIATLKVNGYTWDSDDWLAPTPISVAATPTPTISCGEPRNPWCYDFNPVSGSMIYYPPANVCAYIGCADNFWNWRSYVVQCVDGLFSKSGGIPESCSDHGRNASPLYAH
jgi:hypothetical protein